MRGFVGTKGDVTYGVNCDNSLDDEVSIILLTRLEEERGSGVILKRYAPAEAGLVGEWTDKWLELIGLINVNEVNCTDQQGLSLPPGGKDEARYARLRFWFLSRQEEFVPLLQDFRASQNGPDFQAGDNSDGLERFLENPFLYFYEPDSLYKLAQQLD